jgi:transcriptional regulator with PAS, ATPase and Fis domain
MNKFPIDLLNSDRMLLLDAVKENNINSKYYVDKPIFFHGILSCNQKMHKLFETISKAAKTDASIYISGETGVGKELVAKAIHLESSRADKPFIGVNVANFSNDLLETQLFGHKKGAFTGAHNNSKGLLKVAEHGTLFLDEIACMSSNTQAKLLRVLQERQYYPVGDVQLQTFSATVISASNLSLEDAIKQHHFREDLRYRLEVIPIIVPPLRERKNDIILLYEYFLYKASNKRNWKLQTHLKDKLLNYSWPGNIRELENCAKFSAAMSNGSELRLSDLPSSIQTATGDDATKKKLLEQEIITQALINNCNNKTKTAIQLGISRMTLWRKMKNYNL